MLEVLGLSQAVTTKALKLAEMVPDCPRKSIIPPYNLEALTSPKATKAFTIKNFL